MTEADLFEAYEAVRAPAWAAYLAFRGPVFRYDGTETRTWENFCERSKQGLSVYAAVKTPAWNHYTQQLHQLRGQVA